MNYYRSGSRNNDGYSDRGWRDQNWNPYEGEEEPIRMDNRNRRDENYRSDRRQDSWGRDRGCCRENHDGDFGRRQDDRYIEQNRRSRDYREDASGNYRQRRDYRSMGMPELNQEERNNMSHWKPCKDWNSQNNGQMMPGREDNRVSEERMMEKEPTYGMNFQFQPGNQSVMMSQPRMESRSAMMSGSQSEDQSAMMVRPQSESQSAMMSEPQSEGQSAMISEPQREGQSAMMSEPQRKGQSAMMPEPQREGQSAMMPQPQREGQSAMMSDSQWENQQAMPPRFQPEITLDGGMASGMRNGMPYQTFDYLNVLEEEEQLERDFRRLQSMYPQTVQGILPYIEEACDKMEYEGSLMFDEMPDRNMVRQISDGIYEQVRDIYPMENVQEEADEVLSMQYQGRRRNPPGQNLLNDLVQVMLLQDMHRRRCRHRRCRPHMYR